MEKDTSDLGAATSEVNAAARKQGPFRSYLPSDLYEKLHVGQLKWGDSIIGAALSLGYFQYMLPHTQEQLSPREAHVMELVKLSLKKKFFLNSVPPLLVQFFGVLTSRLSMNVVQLKRSNLLVASLTLMLLYFALRRNNTNVLLSVLATTALGYVPYFQEESVSLSADTLFWFTFMGTLYCWRSYRVLGGGIGRIAHLVALSGFLGLGMGAKGLGFVTLAWVIGCSLLDTWFTASDIGVTSYQLVKKVFMKFMFVITVPLIIFSSLTYWQVSNFQADTREYSKFMSRYFQSYLRGDLMREPSDGRVFYGDTVTLRHSKSLAGYLRSYNATYESGSREQLVALSHDEGNAWNEWVLEAARDSTFRGPVQNHENVRFRHKITGKLLRASDAKPPISEQEYDREVSCTGDSNYTGSTDESWNLEVIDGKHRPVKRGNSRSPVSRGFNVTTDRFTLYNRGRKCHLLGHDARLPQWGFFDQEVLCLDPAVTSGATFEMSVVESKEALTSAVVDRYSMWKLMCEWLWRQFQYENYYARRLAVVQNTVTLVDNSKTTRVEAWPFLVTGDDVIASQIWLWSLLGVVSFGLWSGYHVVTWNPWSWDDDEEAGVDSFQLARILLSDVGIECIAGWFVHLYVFTKAPLSSQLSVVLYVPSLVFGLLLSVQTLNTVHSWNTYAVLVPLSLYIAILMKLSCC